MADEGDKKAGEAKDAGETAKPEKRLAIPPAKQTKDDGPTPVKRGRGRPKGSTKREDYKKTSGRAKAGEAKEVAEKAKHEKRPAAAPAKPTKDDGPTPAKRGRGRPKGDSKKKNKSKSPKETKFVPDEVRAIVQAAIENTIGGQTFSNERVAEWTGSVVKDTLDAILELDKPFKYIVNCTIVQKSGSGLQTTCSCFWDNATDGSCTVKWENESIDCIVLVFALAD